MRIKKNLQKKSNTNKKKATKKKRAFRKNKKSGLTSKAKKAPFPSRKKKTSSPVKRKKRNIVPKKNAKRKKKEYTFEDYEQHLDGIKESHDERKPGSGNDAKGKRFERDLTDILSKHPKYRHILQKIESYDDLHPDDKNSGIDLVATTKNSELWAIQAKAYKPEHFVNKENVDSTLIDTISPFGNEKYTFALIVMTTNNIGPQARRVIRNCEKNNHLKVGIIDREALKEMDIDWGYYINGKKTRRNKKKPYLHQKKALKQTFLGFKIGDRGQLIMTPRSGKTYCATLLIEKMIKEWGYRNFLIAMPSLSLVHQWLNAFFEDVDPKFEFEPLIVCSDRHIGSDASNASKKYALKSADLGFPVTTDSKEIGDFLKKKTKRVKIVFSTFQSSPEIAKAFKHKAKDFKFDLIIADEAHNCAGKKPDSYFTAVLNDKKIRSKKRLFMTGSPKYYGGNKKEVEITSMDDEKQFGKEFFSYSYRNALEDKMVTPYEVYIYAVNDREFFEEYLDGDSPFIDVNGKEIPSANVAAMIGLLQSIKKFGLSKIVAFHSTNKRSREFTQNINMIQKEIGADKRRKVSKTIDLKRELGADYVDGEMRASERKQRLNVLEQIDALSEYMILSNARCLTEGVDIPSLDGICFVDPKQSQIDIFQGSQRVTTKYKGKEKGIILLPVFVPDDINLKNEEDFNRFFEQSNFENVWKVLRALVTYDEALKVEFELICSEKNHKARKIQSGDITERIKFSKGLKNKFGTFCNQLSLKLMKCTIGDWWETFGLVKEFVEKNGRLPLSEETYKNINLGNWIHYQRKSFKGKKLSHDKIQNLESISGWFWFWDINAKWTEKFEECKNFIQKYRKYPSSISSNDFERKLSCWGDSQKRRYKGTINNGSKPLNEEQIKKLNSLNEIIKDVWKWENDFEKKWNQKFDFLENFVIKNKELPSQYSSNSKEVEIQRWFARQKMIKSGTLQDGSKPLSMVQNEKIESLEKIIFTKKEQKWCNKLDLIKEFVIKNKKLPSQCSNDTKEIKLNIWLERQKRRYRNNKFSGNKLKKFEEFSNFLKSFPFDNKWDITNDEIWKKRFKLLQDFVKTKKNLPSTGHKIYKGINIGSWISSQRKNFKNKKLSFWQIDLLETISIWSWDAYGKQYKHMIESLNNFVKENKRLPKDNRCCDEKEKKLAIWCQRQRKKYKEKKLLPKEIKEFELLPGWFWDSESEKEKEWNKNLNLLKNFVKKQKKYPSKHSNISEEKRLSTWFHNQKQAYKNKKLSKNQIKQLELIPGWKHHGNNN